MCDGYAGKVMVRKTQSQDKRATSIKGQIYVKIWK